VNSVTLVEAETVKSEDQPTISQNHILEQYEPQVKSDEPSESESDSEPGFDPTVMAKIETKLKQL
jgi:hypothetical protein